MQGLLLKSTKEAFPIGVLDEAKSRLADRTQNPDNRVSHLGVVTILEGRPLRKLRTIEIAGEVGVDESTIYRYVPKPLIDTMLEWGINTLRGQYNLRHSALTNFAANLAIDESMGFDAAIKQWSELYAAIANPSAIVAAATALPRPAARLISDHTKNIETNIQLIGLREGIKVPAALGTAVFMVAGAHEATYGAADLAGATESMAHRAIAIGQAA
ncbi:MAG TPA: hypothetical protein VG604_00765 [Candidatus Saccharimonadales bacterium]|nr:hypothetical protein [Candidatus Saccharimonadales bacterium]